MDRKKHEIWALSVLIVTLLILLSLLSFRITDLTPINASSVRRPPENLVGSFGAYTALALFDLLGIGAYLLPIVGFGFAWSLFQGMSQPSQGRVHYLGILLLVCSVTGLAALRQPEIHLFGQKIMAGGIIGAAIAAFLKGRLYMVGACILLIGVLLIALLLSTPLTLNASIQFFQRLLAASFEKIRNAVGRLAHIRRAPARYIPPQGTPCCCRSPAGR